MGSVNYNMDKNSILSVHESEKGRIVEFDAGLRILDSIFGVLKTLGSIFGGQQGNSGMVLKVREYPPGIISSHTVFI